MKQTTRTLVGLLALLVVAGAVGGAALWATRDEAKKVEAKEKNEKLFDFDKGRVKSLRVEKDGKLVAALSKDDKGWKITEPVAAEADDPAVEMVVTSLLGVRQKKELADEKDLKAYGLDAPRLQVSVKLDDGKEQGLQVGVDNTFDNTLYVRKLGDPAVRVVDAYQKTSLDKQLIDLRNRKVAHLDDKAEVTRVEVTGVKTPYTLQKEGEGWKLGGEPADAAAADLLVSTVKQLRATGVADENAASLAQYGLDRPRVTVKLAALAGKAPFVRTVIIGQPKGGDAPPKTYAKRDDSAVVFEVDANVLKDLDKQPFDLQDKQLVRVNGDDVRKLVFESPAGRIEVAHTMPAQADGGAGEEQYAVVSPQRGPAKKWKLLSATRTITSLRAAAFDGPVPKDLRKYGFDRSVTLLGEKDRVLLRLRVGAEKDAKRYLLVDGFPKLSRVEKATVDDWPWTLADAMEQPPPPGGPDAGVQAAK